MDWKLFLIYAMMVQTLLLVFFLIAFIAPQLNLFSIVTLLIAAAVSLFVSFPVARYIARKIF